MIERKIKDKEAIRFTHDENSLWHMLQSAPHPILQK